MKTILSYLDGPEMFVVTVDGDILTLEFPERKLQNSGLKHLSKHWFAWGPSWMRLRTELFAFWSPKAWTNVQQFMQTEVVK